MSNICDYIRLRGNLSLTQSEFNEIDGLILSRFSFFPFDNIIRKREVVTIDKLSKRFMKRDKADMMVLWADDLELFSLMGTSTRFGGMKATQFVNIIDSKVDEQFSAITVLLPDDSIFVSFRGTDSTIVGWKEDFIMCFQSNVPSQFSAKEYLEFVSVMYPDRKIRIGGHSKGGNVSIYAAAFASNEVKSRIVGIYNYDGPGFDKSVTECEEYREIVDRINTFIPQTSVVGRLMGRNEEATIVQSKQWGIMQHDAYSWQIEFDKFVVLKSLTNTSDFIDKTIRSLLEETTPEIRRLVIDLVFDVLKETNVETFKDLRSDWFFNSRTILASLKNVDKETKKIVVQTLKLIFNVAKNNFIENIMNVTNRR